MFSFQERVSHGFPGAGGRAPVAADFQPPYFPPPFPGQHQTAQEVFAAAQGSHLAAAAAADPYNVTNPLHNFQSSQVRWKNKSYLFSLRRFFSFLASFIFVIRLLSRFPRSPLL